MADGVGATKLGAHARSVAHSGRITAECDTSGETFMGQGNTGCAYSHARVTITNGAAFTATAASTPGGKLREPPRQDIRENGWRPEWYTGDEGMGPGAQAIEGQGQ